MTLGIFLLQGPRRGVFLTIQVFLYLGIEDVFEVGVEDADVSIVRAVLLRPPLRPHHIPVPSRARM